MSMFFHISTANWFSERAAASVSTGGTGQGGLHLNLDFGRGWKKRFQNCGYLLAGQEGVS